jgi:hypothetical protein
MPNGTYGGVRGWGREAPAYSITFTAVIFNLHRFCGSRIQVREVFFEPDECFL